MQTKLKQFNELYDKFLFDLSQSYGGDQMDLESDLDGSADQPNLEAPQSQPEEIEIQIKASEPSPQEDLQSVQQCQRSQEDLQSCQQSRVELVRSSFNQKFPKFLVKKCQVKFPLDDSTQVPQEVIDQFWSSWSQKILQTIAQDAVQITEDLLTVLFGGYQSYDQSIFNDAAMKLVSQLD